MQTVRTTVQVVNVGPAENGRKLRSFVQARLGVLPDGLFMRLVRSGQIRIDGKRCKPFDRVNTGQEVRLPPVTVDLPAPEKIAPKSDLDAGLDIVHQDQDMLVLNKPAGLPVHPGTGWTDCLTARLKARFPDFAPLPVHRLDRDTSGLLLCARTHDFLRAMHGRWSQVRKAYLCWVEGAWPKTGWQTIVSDLAKVDTGRGQRVRSGQGKRAVTHVHGLGGQGGRSLLLVALETGRTHQIRAHLAESGHAILGDPRYGHGHGLKLHAAALSWPGQFFFSLPSWPAPFAPGPDQIKDLHCLLTTVPMEVT